MRYRTQPQWKIDEIQAMRLDGKPVDEISSRLDVSKETVAFYCRGVEREYQAPMKNEERNELMARWK